MGMTTPNLHCDPTLVIVADSGEEPWCGELSALIQYNPDLPEFCIRRMAALKLDEEISFQFGDEEWQIMRVA